MVGPLAALLLILPLTATAEAVGEDDFKLSNEERFLMKHETIQTLSRLANNHYKRAPLEALNAEEVIVDFMQDLDNHHLFFLAEDQEEFEARFVSTLKPVYLGNGDLHPAFKIFLRYRERTLARIEWVNQRLQEPFDFHTDQTFRPDRSEAEWPATAEEANAIWERRLTYELMQEMLNDEPLERAIERIERRYERTERYVREIEVGNVQEMFLANLAEMYDPHSTYLSADSMEEFAIAMQNELVGIGALLRDEDGYCTIQELIPGGPAELSGKLHPGDKIVAVGQEGEEPADVIDVKIRKVVKMIRGEEGTNVYLTIIPADASDPSQRREITLVRDTVKLTEKLARAEVYEVPAGENRTVAIGVIDLPSFYGSGSDGATESSTTEDVEELLFKLMEKNVQGIVLDLRRNGGGLLNEAVSLTGLFIPRGPVVQIRDHLGRVREDWDRDPAVIYTGPLAVLVSRRSASASEIVAGALQDYNRALIVGDESTHGKGTVQAIYDFSNQRNFFLNPQDRFGAAKITIQKFYLPSGNSTQNKGVVSDISLPSINQFLPIGESDLPHALNWDQIEAVEFRTADNAIIPEAVQVDEKLISILRERSQLRQKELEEFQYLERNIEWFQRRQDQEEFSLNLDLRRSLRASDDAFREEMDAVFDRLSQDRFPRTPLLLEVAEEKDQLHQEKLRSALLPDGRPKANQYYQQVFYYQETPDSKIREIRIESFDYERILRESEAIALSLAEAANVNELPTAAVDSVLQQLRSAERSDEYQIERLLAEALTEHLGEDYQVDNLVPAFFKAMIEIDPTVAEDKPGIDIHLRETLRLLADWNALIEGENPLPIARATTGLTVPELPDLPGNRLSSEASSESSTF